MPWESPTAHASAPEALVGTDEPASPTAAKDSAGLGANAALKYWQAFATLPKFDEADQTKLLADYLTMPLDAKAKEIVDKSEYSLRMMHHAAKVARCEWAIGWETDGVEVLLPQLTAGRLLSTLACIRARIRFEEGKAADAIADILAALRLGRQISRDGSLISILVGYSIEIRTNSTLALFLPKLDPATIKDLRAQLLILPAGLSPAVAIRTCEAGTLEWFLGKVKAAKDKDALIATLAPFGVLAGEPEGRPNDPLAGGRALLKACGGTAEGVLKFCEETRGSYTALAEKFSLPLAEFTKECEREEKRQSGNPVFKLLFPAVAKMHQAQGRAEVRRALLLAAIAIQLGEADALKKHLDPVAGGSFEYLKFDGGFELRSKVVQDGQPVALVVGRRAP